MNPEICPQHFADRGWTRRGNAPTRLRDAYVRGMANAQVECLKTMTIATRHLSGMRRQADRAQA